MRLSHDTHHTKSIFSEKNTIRKKIKLQWKKNTICMKILTIPCLQKIMNTLMYSSHYFRGLPPIPLFHILLKTLFLGGTPLSPFLLEHKQWFIRLNLFWKTFRHTYVIDVLLPGRIKKNDLSDQKSVNEITRQLKNMQAYIVDFSHPGTIKKNDLWA